MGRSFRKLLFAFLLALSAGISFTSCADDSTGPGPVGQNPADQEDGPEAQHEPRGAHGTSND
jgi:hypothetical protein